MGISKKQARKLKAAAIALAMSNYREGVAEASGDSEKRHWFLVDRAHKRRRELMEMIDGLVDPEIEEG